MKTFYKSSTWRQLLCTKIKSTATIKSKQQVTKNRKAPTGIAALIALFFVANICMAQSGVPTGMSRLSIHLLLNTNGGSSNTADGCMALYNSNFTPGLGPDDSYKFTNVDENMAIPCGNSLLSVVGKPYVVDYDTIPLKIWQYRQSTYLFEFDATNFSPGLVAVLKDNYLQQESAISLSAVTTLPFSLTADSASAAADRFCIYLRPASTLPLCLVVFSAAQKENGIQVAWTMANETIADHYEVEKSVDAATFTRQATVSANASNSATHQWLDKELVTGSNYYRIKTVSKTGEVVLSKIVKVLVNNKGQSIGIYPNPVKGNTIGLQMYNVEKGTYQLQIFNAGGQPVYTTSISHTGGTATLQINTARYLGKGNYTLRLTNGKSVYNKTILIN